MPPSRLPPGARSEPGEGRRGTHTGKSSVCGSQGTWKIELLDQRVLHQGGKGWERFFQKVRPLLLARSEFSQASKLAGVGKPPPLRHLSGGGSASLWGRDRACGGRRLPRSPLDMAGSLSPEGAAPAEDDELKNLWFFTKNFLSFNSCTHRSLKKKKQTKKTPIPVPGDSYWTAGQPDHGRAPVPELAPQKSHGLGAPPPDTEQAVWGPQGSPRA